MLGVYAIDQKLDDPVGALSAHGIAGIWGTLACGLFTSPRLAQYNGSAIRKAACSTPAPSRSWAYQALGSWSSSRSSSSLSFATFWAIKDTYGLRVTAEEEEAGLDISEHGMYGYPEQFIPAPELVGYARGPSGRATPHRPAPTTTEVPAS